MQLEFSRRTFENYSGIEFYENPSIGNRVSYMRTDGQTDITKLILAFRSFANAPETWIDCGHDIYRPL
jgi:hypothetical protein